MLLILVSEMFQFCLCVQLHILCTAAAENRRGAQRCCDRNRYVGRNGKFQVVVVSGEEKSHYSLK